MKRSKQISIRLTEDEFARLNAAAEINEKSRNDYIIDRCVNDIDGVFALAYKQHREAQNKAKESPKKSTGKIKFFLDDLNFIKKEGRPRKAKDKTLRDKHVQIFVSDHEYKTIKERAEKAGQSIVDYMLAETVYKRDVVLVDRNTTDALSRIYAELNREGVNLNQIAARANALASMASIEGINVKLVESSVSSLRDDLGETKASLIKALNDVTKILEDTSVRLHRRC